jgi:hypothetical protein
MSAVLALVARIHLIDVGWDTPGVTVFISLSLPRIHAMDSPARREIVRKMGEHSYRVTHYLRDSPGGKGSAIGAGGGAVARLVACCAVAASHRESSTAVHSRKTKWWRPSTVCHVRRETSGDARPDRVGYFEFAVGTAGTRRQGARASRH